MDYRILEVESLRRTWHLGPFAFFFSFFQHFSSDSVRVRVNPREGGREGGGGGSTLFVFHFLVLALFVRHDLGGGAAHRILWF